MAPDKDRLIKNKMLQELVKASVIEPAPLPAEAPQMSERDIPEDERIYKFLLSRRPAAEMVRSRREEELTDYFDKVIGRWERTPTTIPLARKLFPMEHIEAWVSVFLKYNTPLPSSAAVERIFSTAGDIIKPKRACLSSANFEELVFLKGNLELSQS